MFISSWMFAMCQQTNFAARIYSETLNEHLRLE